MTNRLMISVAALALIAGTGFANAQGTHGARGPVGSAARSQARLRNMAALPSAVTPAARWTATQRVLA